MLIARVIKEVLGGGLTRAEMWFESGESNRHTSYLLQPPQNDLRNSIGISQVLVRWLAALRHNLHHQIYNPILRRRPVSTTSLFYFEVLALAPSLGAENWIR